MPSLRYCLKIRLALSLLAACATFTAGPALALATPSHTANPLSSSTQPTQAKSKRPNHTQPKARGRSRRQALTGTQIKQGLAILLELNPHLKKQLAKVQQRFPNRYPQLVKTRIGRSWNLIEPLIKAKKDDPIFYALRIKDLFLTQQARRIASQIAKDKKAKHLSQKSLAQKIKALLTRRFEVRIQIRKHFLSKAQTHRQAMIQTQIQALIAQAKINHKDRPRRKFKRFNRHPGKHNRPQHFKKNNPANTTQPPR